jgi:hypothetical protein
MESLEPVHTVVTRPAGLDRLRMITFRITLISLAVLTMLPLAHVAVGVPERLAGSGLVAFATALSISTRGGVRMFGTQVLQYSPWGEVVRERHRFTGFKLYGPTRVRPESRIGSPATVAFGEVLVVVGWMVFTAVFTAEMFWVTGTAHEDAPTAFNATTAGLAAVCYLLILVCDTGFHLAGFITLPRSAAGWVRRTVNTVIVIAGAGYDELLKHAGWLSLTWVPVHTWDALEGWWHLTPLAVVVCVPLGFIWLAVYLQAVTLFGWLLGKLLGKENAAGEALEDSLPVGARGGSL